MRVHDELRRHTGQRDHFIKEIPVLLRWLRDPGGPTTDPSADLFPGARDGLGPGIDSWVGGNTSEGKQAFPRQPHPSRTVQLRVKPAAQAIVLGITGKVRIEQDVGVDQDHFLDFSLKSSSSSTSKT